MTARSAGPPAVVGAAISLPDTLRRELSPRSGRLADTLRLLALILISVVISETFGIPEVAISAYIIVFITRDEAFSSISLGIAVIIIATFAIGATLVTLTIVAGEPALRLAAMAFFSFVAMWCVRAINGPLGTAAFVIGIIAAFALSLADDVPSLSRAPATLSATWLGYTPTGLTMPPEDVLVRFLLWLWLVLAMPSALVIVGHLLAGRDPARLLEDGVISRLAAAARFCRGLSDAMSLPPGVDELVKRLDVAARAHKWPTVRVQAEQALLDGVDLLVTLLRVWPTLGGQPGDPQLQPVAEACEAAARQAGDQRLASAQQAGDMETVAAVTTADHARSTLLKRIDDAMREVGAALIARDAARGQKGPPKKAEPLLRADAFANPNHRRFAIKVTLAVMACYVTFILLDWHSIRTCIFTCFFVALGSTGDTGHKAALRLGGCILGMALGLGTIVFVIPHLDGIGQLLVLLAIVLGPACWLSTSSERVAYAGWQLILAFNIGVLYGFGPSIDMTIARDRTFGILLGDVVVTIIFVTLWPVSTADVVRQAAARALDGLADLLLARPGAAATRRVAVEAALTEAHGNLLNMRYEEALRSRHRGGIGLDNDALELIRQLTGPITMFKDVGASEDDARMLGDWLRLYAQWVRTGECAAALASVGKLRSQGERVTDRPVAIWREAILDGLERLRTRVGPHAVEQTSTTASPEGDAVASTLLR